MSALPASNGVSDRSHLTRREKLVASLHQKYLRYFIRFNRWRKCKGWLRYVVSSPVSALATLFKSQPLPLEWCHQPMTEMEFLGKLAADQFRGLSKLD